MLLRRVDSDAASAEDGVEEQELLVWYLEQKESEMETEEDLQTQRSLAKKVLRRMVKVSHAQMRSFPSTFLTSFTGKRAPTDTRRRSGGRRGRRGASATDGQVHVCGASELRSGRHLVMMADTQRIRSVLMIDEG